MDDSLINCTKLSTSIVDCGIMYSLNYCLTVAKYRKCKNIAMFWNIYVQ